MTRSEPRRGPRSWCVVVPISDLVPVPDFRSNTPHACEHHLSWDAVRLWC